MAWLDEEQLPDHAVAMAAVSFLVNCILYCPGLTSVKLTVVTFPRNPDCCDVLLWNICPHICALRVMQCCGDGLLEQTHQQAAYRLLSTAQRQPKTNYIQARTAASRLTSPLGQLVGVKATMLIPFAQALAFLYVPDTSDPLNPHLYTADLWLTMCPSVLLFVSGAVQCRT